MLFYDPTESREGTRLPQDVIEYGYGWDGVERVTGGDFIVTPFLNPTHKIKLLSQKMSAVQIAKQMDMSMIDVAKALSQSNDIDNILYEYLYRGSVVVQRKSGSDLIASLQGPRLNESLSRMNRSVPYRCQRMLLYTGVFQERDGKVVLDDRKTGVAYSAFVMALTAWCNRGGVTVNLDSDDKILEWVQLLEKQLASYEHEGDEKQVYPSTYFPPDVEEDAAFQVPTEVDDWRITMVTFPGLGPDRVNALKTHLDDLYDNTTLWLALQHATLSKTADEIKGWGSTMIKNNRRWLGIPDGWDLCLQPQGDDE